jgi:hypothetical protein
MALINSNNNLASFYRLLHFAKELSERDTNLVWISDSSLRLKSSANYFFREAKIKDPRVLVFTPLTDWTTENIFIEVIQHVNSMILSLPFTSANFEIQIELANLKYRLEMILTAKSKKVTLD